MTPDPISVHVLSDSLGETGEMVARAVISQFAPDSFRIERLPRVSTPDKLREMVLAHCGIHCIFFYTLVDTALRAEMERMVMNDGVHGVDLLGPSVALLSKATGRLPTGEAGAIHRTDEEYFERIGATEFAVSHDDGRNPEDLPIADIVLIGVSRTSKTPLSMYLAFKGYRVANVPFAPGVEPPAQLFTVDPRKVFGLVTSATVLVGVRRERMREIGAFVPRYADREAIEQELEEARALMRRIGCIVIRTDNRAVEESAQEIVRYLDAAVVTED
jgi:[pyruvate, water dikinase]-phosphate phosphotransferase / [pyruvate, water dikinase] kinase